MGNGGGGEEAGNRSEVEGFFARKGDMGCEDAFLGEDSHEDEEAARFRFGDDERGKEVSDGGRHAVAQNGVGYV